MTSRLNHDLRQPRNARHALSGLPKCNDARPTANKPMTAATSESRLAGPGNTAATRGCGNFRSIHNRDANGLAWARLRAGRRLIHGKPTGAHVTLTHDAAPGGILRHVIRALHHAVLAADALV